jgi:hypothetical protein
MFRLVPITVPMSRSLGGMTLHFSSVSVCCAQFAFNVTISLWFVCGLLVAMLVCTLLQDEALVQVTTHSFS